MKKVFLGGTCNGSTWRDRIIPMLKIDYFNPVVGDWTSECMAEEIKQRKECDYVLYVITEITSLYSIAEVVDDSNKRPEKTFFVILNKEQNTFTDAQYKHLKKVADMVIANGGTVAESIEDIAEILNIL